MVAPAVIELDDAGCVISVSPLPEEIASTVWLGGVACCSTLSTLPDGDRKTLSDVVSALCLSDDINSLPVYAWHIPHVNPEEGDLNGSLPIARL